jgi:hypothetical protein
VKIGSNLSINASGVLSATGGGAINYSTTEQQIGTWIDGKPLYQKTFVCTTPTAKGTNQTVANIDNSYYVVNIDGIAVHSNSVHIPVNFSQGESAYIVCWVDTGAIRMVTTNLAYLSCPCYITIKYTKTTD